MIFIMHHVIGFQFSRMPNGGEKDLSNKNYISGAGFESRFIRHLIHIGQAVKAGRFFASKGITDVWWVDQNGIHNEAQCKYSKNKPYIRPQELRRLKSFAKLVSGIIKVWIVKRQSRKPIVMEALN